jgi:DUF4097 and DUF4098 domain-containing protein YvlB
MRTESFATAGPVRLDVAVPAGTIELEAVPGAVETRIEFEVVEGDPAHEHEARIELRQRGGVPEVAVVAPRARRSREQYRVSISCPAGSDARISTASADVQARGPFAEVELETASGDVDFEEAGRIKVRSASGDVAFQRVRGDANVNTASGDLKIGVLVGEGRFRTASGDVVVHDAARGLDINTVSGDQTITSVAAGDVRLRAASGDVHVGIRRGSRVYVDARSGSGALESELELGDEEPAADGPLVELSAVTASGDVKIVRAPELPSA